MKAFFLPVSAGQSLASLLLWLTCFAAYASSSYNPHSPDPSAKKNPRPCLTCHKQQPTGSPASGIHIIPSMKNFKQTATGMCNTCHGNEKVSHVVGVTPEYSIPADLPLDHDRQITCLTCHYTHGSLSSDKPMASSSFMDQLFNRERMGKSFLLRRNNANGDLCLACHNQ